MRRGTRIWALFAPACVGLLSLLVLSGIENVGVSATAEFSIDPVDWQIVHKAYSAARTLAIDAGESVAKWSKGFSSPSAGGELPYAQRLELVAEENRWINGLVSWMLPKMMQEAMPTFLITFFRMWILTCVVYLTVGGVWCYYIYYCFGNQLFELGKMPSYEDMREQIAVGMKAIPAYALLETLSCWLVENGWTKAYARIDDMGLVWYILYLVPYLAFCEFWVYWAHRLMHDIPWAYKHLHHTHHKYNKEHTLSPFAGIAFHPIDGVLQVVPYTLGLFLFPIHFTTHIVLTFAAELWTHSLHDCIDMKIDPIMGSGHHTVHHLIYKDNYGQYFIYFDWLFGTLTTPEEVAARREAARKVK